ncbi:MAG: sigma 54-interacting transcriptional regulator [Candidatus Edwardsbacteria bacterium]|jgi:Nif-specific regulatory protein|nr:sigma 54-interacting transcriptional regulator [Candidatus Edwardsbacteria bacterium]
MQTDIDPKKELEFFYTFSQTLFSTMDQGKLLDIIIETAKNLTHAEGSSLLLLDDAGQNLLFAHATGEVSEELKKLTVPLGQGIAGWVARERKPQIVNAAEQDERWYKGIDEQTNFTTRSLLCVPLLVGDRTVGVIEVINKCDGTNFCGEDQEILLKVASLAATVLENATRYRRLEDRFARLQQEVAGRYDIIASSQAMGEVLNLAQRVAAGNTTVLLQGENGTGKELLARYIHGQSPRAESPFIAVNCAAIPLDLLESELFGYEKGAFTGAAGRRKGHFEAADGGTIFLDEVGDLPLAVQAKILRVVQEREFLRLGGSETVRVDVRIVAATNQNLQELVKRGRFREDLYYRLNVFQIFLPPLRQRADDIPVLAHHFLERFNRETTKNISGFTDDAMATLREYAWPGNVRELQNVIERAMVLATGRVIERHHLPQMRPLPGGGSEIAPLVNLDDAQRRFKRQYIEGALAANGWNQRRTAKLLGIQPTYLSRLIKELGITK